MNIAETIYDQLGRKTFIMLGAQNICNARGDLTFKIRGSKTVTHIKIHLDQADDLYTMYFYKVRGGNIKTVRTITGVYNDMLRPMIEDVTGLATRL